MIIIIKHVAINNNKTDKKQRRKCVVQGHLVDGVVSERSGSAAQLRQRQPHPLLESQHTGTDGRGNMII